jgi:hypothetical protein
MIGAGCDVELANAFAELRDEFVDALRKSPTGIVATPDGREAQATVAYLIAEEFTGDPGYEHLESLLRVLNYAAWESTDPETRTRALEWIGQAANRHGVRHRDARVMEIAEGRGQS